MSIERCHKHGESYDTDFQVECPECEAENDEYAVAPYRSPEFIATEAGEVILGASGVLPSMQEAAAARRDLDRRALASARERWFKRLG